MKTLDAIVIGAGQAGLAAGYHLRHADLHFLMLDAAKVGDTWSRRWDSLRLFTPARYNGLPGMPFPGRPYELPGKDDVAAYLRGYVQRFALPVRENVGVRRVHRVGGTFRVELHDGKALRTRAVIVATGANQRPHTPKLAGGVAPRIVQLHSSEYRAPAQLPAGRVLVVGAGNSGAQIALELAGRGRSVVLAGPAVGSLPRRLLGRDVYDWLWHTLLRTSVDSTLGRRRMATRRYAGDPLIGIAPEQFERRGVQRVGRVAGTREGQPLLDDDTVVDDVAAIVWCTGFRPDYSWIELPVIGLDGYPIHRRGVATDVPGLAFVGMRYQYRMRSALIGGVGEDAAHVVEQIVAYFSGRPVVRAPVLRTTGA